MSYKSCPSPRRVIDYCFQHTDVMIYVNINLFLFRSTHGIDMGTTCTSTMMCGVKARQGSPSSTGKKFAAICTVTFADSLVRTK